MSEIRIKREQILLAKIEERDKRIAELEKELEDLIRLVVGDSSPSAES